MSALFPVTPLLSSCPLALKATPSPRRALRAPTHRRRMDAEGGRVVHRERRARKLAVVVAVQNVLVAACLIATLYVYRGVQDQERDRASEDDVHIDLGAITTISGNATLQFKSTEGQNMMSLAGEKNDKIYVNCTGPYILHMYVCYKSLSEKETSGTLQLQVVGRQTHDNPFPLQTSNLVCRGLNSIVYLRMKDQVSLRLSAKDDFRIENVTVGLRYLLRQCQYW